MTNSNSTERPFVCRWRDALHTRWKRADLAILHELSAYMTAAGGRAFPGHDRLAERTGYSVGQVRRTLAAAVDAGWLRIVTRGGRLPGGRTRAVEYAAALPAALSTDHDPDRLDRAPTRGPNVSTAQDRPFGPRTHARPTSHRTRTAAARARERAREPEPAAPAAAAESEQEPEPLPTTRGGARRPPAEPEPPPEPAPGPEPSWSWQTSRARCPRGPGCPGCTRAEALAAQGDPVRSAGLWRAIHDERADEPAAGPAAEPIGGHAVLDGIDARRRERDAAAGCGRCDEGGWLDLDDGVARCDHRPALTLVGAST